MNKTGWSVVRGVLGSLLIALATLAGGNEVFESARPPRPTGEVDRIVFARLEEAGIEPVLCSDAVFVRRVYLDVIGTLPTAREVREFLADPDENKRSRLIDDLLERPEFADYWSMKWGDVLRIKAEIPVNLWPNAAQAYHRWVRASLAENKPYDQFVREMLTASGSNFQVGPVNFYRAIQDKTPEGIAATVALTFMGARAEAWPEDRLSGTAVFFSQIGYKPTSQWKEEIVYWDPLLPAARTERGIPGRVQPGTAELRPSHAAMAAGVTLAPDQPLQAVFPDGTSIELPPGRDPRAVFADWLITPENPWFTRSIVNRVWAWLMGRGIVHEPDDLRDDNPPSDQELLDYLEGELIAGDYDLRRLYRRILNSHTYQFSSLPHPGVADEQVPFARYFPRRLDAEVLIDAINQITGTSDLYTSPIPEPFTFIPREMRAIALADGSITSQFLALFGRSARATGMANERSNQPVPAQWLHLLNSSHIQQKLAGGPWLTQLLDADRSRDEMIEDLYLTILSRPPTPHEVRAVGRYVQSAPGPRAAAIDLAWALINTHEFLYRH